MVSFTMTKFVAQATLPHPSVRVSTTRFVPKASTAPAATLCVKTPEPLQVSIAKAKFVPVRSGIRARPWLSALSSTLVTKSLITADDGEYETSFDGGLCWPEASFATTLK